MFTLKIEKPIHNPYSKRQMNADVFCDCCGRGIPDRNTAIVVITRGSTATGDTIFLPIPWNEVKGADSVEWGSFVGRHCAKRLPKAYKVSQKRVAREWVKNGCP